MPRDLGKAKRADLSGKFPGEQAEYGSALARFLEGSGQLKPLTEGAYQEASGNGHENQTETSRGRTEGGRSKDTEVAPPRGGNGQHAPPDTVFDTPLNDAFAQEEMFPEAALSPEMMPEPMTPEALAPEPLSPTPLAPQTLSTESPNPAPLAPQALSPELLAPEPVGKASRRAEPQSLDSVPDLLSPELDGLADEASDEQEDTELLADRNRAQTVRPEPAELAPPDHSDDTGMLIAEAFSTRKEDGWDSVEMDAEDGEEPKITDKLNRRPEGDEDLTKVFSSDKVAHDGEKITNKVEPKRDVDPRTADPNAVVRDTVNFYNQTQSFQEARKGQSFPTISPTVVNSTQPLGLRDQPPKRPEPELAPSLEAAGDTDTLRPGPAETVFDDAALGEPTLGPVESLDALDLAPAAPAELTAESDLEEADKRETDKFSKEDREPPQLPLPEGTDKVDKSQLPPRRKVAMGEPEGLEPLADEKVAGGKDTQRFYVAEILAKKTAESTDELQPAEEGPPPTARGKTAAETSSDYTTGQAPRQRPSKRQKAIEPEPLPAPREVHTDFIEHVHVSASERIIPGLDEEPAPSEVTAKDDGDDTVDEEAAIERVTDKLGAGRPVPRPGSGRRQAADTDSGRRAVAGTDSGRKAAATTASGRNRVSDAVSQRLEMERAETLRLIEQAEAVALKLRDASNQSHGDLKAISERRETARASRQDLQRRAQERDQAAEAAPDAETVFDFPPMKTPAPAVREADERETEEVVKQPRAEARQRSQERVPTRSIGEIVDELQRSAERPATSLNEILDSARHKPANGGNGHKKPVVEDDDVDLWVAASSRLRETVETAREDDSGRVPALSRAEGRAARDEEHAEPARPSSQSSLAGDLDRLWQVLDSRRGSRAVEPTSLEPPTLLVPAADKARITAREPEVPVLEDGWTQEMLWPTLAGIAVVTFALGAIFVWVLVRALA